MSDTQQQRKPRDVQRAGLLGTIKHVMSKQPGVTLGVEEITDAVREYLPATEPIHVIQSLDYASADTAVRFPDLHKVDDFHWRYTGGELPLPQTIAQRLAYRREGMQLAQSVEPPNYIGRLFEAIAMTRDGSVLLRCDDGLLWKAQRVEL